MEFPQKAATFTLNIEEPFITQSLKNEYVKRLAALMNIPASRLNLQENCIDPEEVYTEEGHTFLKYNLKA